ncbi:hypothetical protein VIBNISFn27_p10059 [Vibrio nigripulchritudo SFn27]|uniref:RES domain-containing protein n=1 Tax=Vibrio nigripulchritudo TaxID=28173 RepID=A0A9P1JL73_9VIBR|nr:RES domain-containing protein [Vibrio nigripulchritudo]CBJ93100.1 Protein of unknown function [Vibrio nigripulchritudo]CCN85916.1 hypothetical protein VIBNIBLFn1_p0055 [Vibrio nigripulchritudo BLFn1]CCN91909.1 hypothetical protein VIBNISFn27_p10059 [Vibrio nigripulchritudo SFn27]CCN97713.1 hypothetical protein VIBNIENn2_p0055 [Vibrio nigripulchritudo ENn2]CCO43944.1 hypothetical protein VIBNISFn135_p10059 [Vibrio nigripulchritudo SFn135]
MSVTQEAPTLTIPAGTQLYRALSKVFSSEGERAYEALDPNPYLELEWLSDIRALYEDGVAVAGRFAPFRDQSGSPVPALYLAPMKETAYYEFVLRPVGNSAIKALSKNEFVALEVATVVFEDALTLADCRENYLLGGEDEFWDKSHDELFQASQLKSLDAARTLAKSIYDQYPDIDGLVWHSVQHGRVVPVYVIFGPKRRGSIVRTIEALDDIPTWKPYLRAEVREKRLVVSADLAAIL